MSKKALKNMVKSLFLVSQEYGKEESLYSDLKALFTFLQKVPEISRLRISRVKEILEEFIQETCRDDKEILFPFIEEVVKRGLIHHMDEIVQSYEELFYRSRGIQIVKIETPKSLPQEEKAYIESRLKSILKMNVICHYSKNKNLIGGMRIQIGELFYDFSIKSRLNQIKTAILKGA